MFLENLIAAENKEEYINSLSDNDKKTLLAEIDTKTKEAESEYMKKEVLKNQLEQDEKNLMEQLNSMGIASYEDLDIEINKLEKSLNEELVKYANAIQGE